MIQGVAPLSAQVQGAVGRISPRLACAQVMGGKFHIVEKVHSLILLAFTNFIVPEVEKYLSLNLSGICWGWSEKNGLIFLLN